MWKLWRCWSNKNIFQNIWGCYSYTQCNKMKQFHNFVFFSKTLQRLVKATETNFHFYFWFAIYFISYLWNSYFCHFININTAVGPSRHLAVRVEMSQRRACIKLRAAQTYAPTQQNERYCNSEINPSWKAAVNFSFIMFIPHSFRFHEVNFFH